jgi:cytochrome c553
VSDWARAWHELGAQPFPSEGYNAALQAITDAFTARSFEGNEAGGSALSALRTNEVALARPWELREFHLADDGQSLRQAPTERTSDMVFQGTPRLADFINEREQAILDGHYRVPRSFQGEPFQAGAAPSLFQTWDAPGIHSAKARQAFSLNTCSGCHGARDTGTDFVHVSAREAGEPAALSGFLLGLARLDPSTGALVSFNDLDRRKLDLESVVCPCPARRACSSESEGSYRVH